MNIVFFLIWTITSFLFSRAVGCHRPSHNQRRQTFFRPTKTESEKNRKNREKIFIEFHFPFMAFTSHNYRPKKHKKLLFVLPSSSWRVIRAFYHTTIGVCVWAVFLAMFWIGFFFHFISSCTKRNYNSTLTSQIDVTNSFIFFCFLSLSWCYYVFSFNTLLN